MSFIKPINSFLNPKVTAQTIGKEVNGQLNGKNWRKDPPDSKPVKSKAYYQRRALDARKRQDSEDES